MGKPAARIGDGHSCPAVTPGTGVPHVGGVIIGPGCGTVLIEGLPAATMGDACACVGEPDKITQGSTGVFLGGKPAARSGDRCAHGGRVTGGCGSVLIGEGEFMCLPAEGVPDSDFIEPSDEEKREIISQVIKDCVAMLSHKHKLLKNGDPDTLKEFKKWFGTDDVNARITILKMIKKVLNVCQKLTVDCFDQIYNEKDRMQQQAVVYNKDRSYRIFLGDPFWQLGGDSKHSKSGVLIHELSHFKKTGNTLDHAYYETGCLRLVETYPEYTLNNADSFRLFVES
ncbi:M35 family metallo-endopeptidase [Niastella populi]|uniref:Lysine-specific metallo-endopeptidase domain-containing protein n=1 Tax=Niastella populi TaxID=550983 RepID=A0A1V9F5Q0_9BACT|nr:M35 family metallo-endopeptidase [Niastella populi]OQP53566.1 hypothetical protein A4R26_06200 [Niastella populi]